MKKRSKAYKENVKLIDSSKKYAIDESIEVIQKFQSAKFDETVEFTVKLGIDTKHSDQQIRGTLILPHGIGKTVKVVVIAKGEKVAEAEAAGADICGSEEIVEKIKGGWVDFDVLITTPDMMKSVGVLGKVLGKRGLMPSPKTGTITFDIKKAVEEFRKGKIEYRADKYGIVHMPVGKKSFVKDKLKDNILAIYDILLKVKPSSAKGLYVRGLYLASTMSPGVELDAVSMK
ncbi:MAG: 50S ribosomal protein L1 [Candidatus Margulisbacteria bacterium GWF2_35_9]|nr:MAG: 50S ribosomal protein L1 [Candidatus Margulisbacteria bacterium GWF2_35_9]